MNAHIKSIRRASTLLLAALVAASASGQVEPSGSKNLPIEELKSAYLSCEHASMRGRLDSPTVMQCSVVYEALKWRAFDGDFEKLLAWSRSQARAFTASTGSHTPTPAPAAPAHSSLPRAP